MKISKRAIQKAREEVLAEQVLKSAILVFCLVMNGRHKWGATRLNAIVKDFAQTFRDYRARYGEVAFEAIEKHAKEMGIEVDWV